MYKRDKMKNVQFLASLFLSLSLGALVACGGGDSSTGSECPTTNPPTYDSFAKNFFDSYCTSCHASNKTGAMRGGAPSGLNYDTLAGIQRDLAGIDSEAAAGPNGTNTSMPEGLPKPTQAEREMLGQFLACEAAK